MFLYHLKIALKGLRRTPILSAVLVAAIALGICASTTFIALRHVFEKDPVPGKSRTLFYVRLDNWDPARAYVAEDPKSLPTQISYRDMRELMRSNIPTHQTGTYQAAMFVFPPDAKRRPFKQPVRMVFSDFFTMFNLPFEYGSPWDKAAERRLEPVIVIDRDVNAKLFGGGNNVGKVVRVGERDFKIAGILGDWKPAFRAYDPSAGPAVPEGMFMPFEFTVPLKIATSGNSDGWTNSGTTFEELLQSEQVWIQFWAELPTPDKQQAYREFVDSYVRDQKRHGRFQRPLHTAVTSMPDLLAEFGFVPTSVKTMSIVSVLFLIVCSLNIVGLLLGKFLARMPEVSVRRALGASRADVFWQHVVECELIGLIGGAIGIVMSLGLLRILAKFLQQTNAGGVNGVALDAEMVGVSIVLSLLAGFVAGIYPSWRVCSIAPAVQLKLQ